jgi:hypothetical protein
MINRFLFIIAASLLLFTGCNKGDIIPSTANPVSIGEIVTLYASPSYVIAVGSGKVFKTVPDTIAKVVDSVYGFEGGFGGKTGKDTIYLKKSDLGGGWPDTTKAGGYSLEFQKFNTFGYRTHHNVNIVLAGQISNPGPTDISGTYKRTANNYVITIDKIFNGVYLITNPGGGAVAAQPYLLYNYKNVSGNDSLAFPIQTSTCGNGLKLVSTTAPDGLTAQQYDKSHPPAITSTSPVTLSWRVLEFPGVSSGSTHPGFALCAWGTGVRTFIKQ